MGPGPKKKDSTCVQSFERKRADPSQRSGWQERKRRDDKEKGIRILPEKRVPATGAGTAKTRSKGILLRGGLGRLGGLSGLGLGLHLGARLGGGLALLGRLLLGLLLGGRLLAGLLGLGRGLGARGLRAGDRVRRLLLLRRGFRFRGLRKDAGREGQRHRQSHELQQGLLHLFLLSARGTTHRVTHTL